MLIEIRCARFRKGAITFHRGLNVVVGDPQAANSIGKSSLLMVIDFIFGGESFLDHNADTVKELGDHEYSFTLRFNGKDFHFIRSTVDPQNISVCNAKFEATSTLALSDYTAFLGTKYLLKPTAMSFRAAVGPYSRIWGKPNLVVDRPLNVASGQPTIDAIENLIRLFALFKPIQGLVSNMKEKMAAKKALDAAFRQKLINRITKTQHNANQLTISELNTGLSDIKEHLSSYAINVSQITNQKTLELKMRQDQLVHRKFVLESKMARVKQNLPGRAGVRSAQLEKLSEFFPNINQKRLTEITSFHTGLNKILSTELKAVAAALSAELEDVNLALREVTTEIEASLRPIENPGLIVDRVLELSSNLHRLRTENQYFTQHSKLTATMEDLKESVSQKKEAIAATISGRINRALRKMTSLTYSPERRQPVLTLGLANYSFEVLEDTGTGKAYADLLMFDLAILSYSRLPFLIHDSLLFKNVENHAVAELLPQYSRQKRQCFIALDEIHKYGAAATALIKKQQVLELDNKNVLYDKDWRS